MSFQRKKTSFPSSQLARILFLQHVSYVSQHHSSYFPQQHSPYFPQQHSSKSYCGWHFRLLFSLLCVVFCQHELVFVFNMYTFNFENSPACGHICCWCCCCLHWAGRNCSSAQIFWQYSTNSFSVPPFITIFLFLKGGALFVQKKTFVLLTAFLLNVPAGLRQWVWISEFESDWIEATKGIVKQDITEGENLFGKEIIASNVVR